ncbi:hypothetical protein, partial [Atlanticothrix silvestris]|uniref:hypothetical protein n=1 Tax=Atlanticothrix silvestris TaxID=2840444 RepID=UPI001BDC297F
MARLHQATHFFSCELSEGLACKFLIIYHLNQAFGQYVDLGELASVPAATPLLCAMHYTLITDRNQVLEHWALVMGDEKLVIFSSSSPASPASPA